jgi:hypothetical protein
VSGGGTTHARHARGRHDRPARPDPRLGSAPLGDLYELIPEERALGTVARAYDLGVRLFDTAPLYGYGLSEHRVGHVLRRHPRDSYVLSTKVGRHLVPKAPAEIDRGQWTGGLNMQPVYDYSYDGTMRALEQSHQRSGSSGSTSCSSTTSTSGPTARARPTSGATRRPSTARSGRWPTCARRA